MGDLRLSVSIIRKSRSIFTKERRTIRQKSGCLNHSNERIFQVNAQMQGKIKDSWKGVNMYKGVGVRLADFISFILNIPWKWNNLVSLRPNYFIFIGYLIAGRGGALDPPLQCAPNHLLRTKQHLPLQAIQLGVYFFKGHYIENSLIWMIYPSALLTVWFSAHFIFRHSMISAQT